MFLVPRPTACSGVNDDWALPGVGGTSVADWLQRLQSVDDLTQRERPTRFTLEWRAQETRGTRDRISATTSYADVPSQRATSSAGTA